MRPVTVRAGESAARTRAHPALLAAGVELLVVHGTIISAEHVAQVDRTTGEAGRRSTSRPSSPISTFRSSPAVLDHHTALHLMRTGAAGVIVGYGRPPDPPPLVQVLGIGVPMATAIADAAAARRDYLDETGGRCSARHRRR